VCPGRPRPAGLADALIPVLRSAQTGRPNGQQTRTLIGVSPKRPTFMGTAREVVSVDVCMKRAPSTAASLS
jgi:hypothetical protein